MVRLDHQRDYHCGANKRGSELLRPESGGEGLVAILQEIELSVMKQVEAS